MKVFVYLAIATLWFVGSDVAAKAAITAPDLDGGTLTGLVSGITGLYVAVRMYRASRK